MITIQKVSAALRPFQPHIWPAPRSKGVSGYILKDFSRKLGFIGIDTSCKPEDMPTICAALDDAGIVFSTNDDSTLIKIFQMDN